MKPLNSIAILAMIVLSVPSAHAEVFVAPFGGYSFGTSQFDFNDGNVDSKDAINVAESGHYGIMLGVATQDPGNMYLLYSHQGTELGTESESSFVTTPLSVDYVHLGGTLYFPEGKARPYATASAGVTQLRPSGDFSTETRFSMAIGGGIDYQITPAISLFADVRGYATFVNTDTSLFCNESQCLWNIKADVMWQAQANAGLSIKF